MLSKYTCKNYAEEGPFQGWYVLLKDEIPVLATPVYHGPNGYSTIRDTMKQLELDSLANRLKHSTKAFGKEKRLPNLDFYEVDDDF